jgi:hypothetical protein
MGEGQEAGEEGAGVMNRLANRDRIRARQPSVPATNILALLTTSSDLILKPLGAVAHAAPPWGWYMVLRDSTATRDIHDRTNAAYRCHPRDVGSG